METYQRPHVALLLDRLSEPPRRIISIFGPRQTGKTTIVRQALRSIQRPHLYVDVDQPDSASAGPSSHATTTFLPGQPRRDAEWLLRIWEDARTKADESPEGAILAIDEIQKVPQWSEIVKGLWDQDRAEDRWLHVVILGSAPLLMQSGLNESLAGRFEPLSVAHWGLQEMARAFDFDLSTYLYFGGYPGAAHLVNEETRWRDYVLGALVAPNIERDILAMTRVDKPALLKRLYSIGSQYSGQVMPYNKMLGQLADAGNTTTLARHLDLLGNAGLLTGLQNYSENTLRRTRASSPKLNVLNTALMTAESGYTFAEAKADRSFWGRIVESAVGAHLLNTATQDINVHYWREGRNELDFVLRRGARLVAIEVKSGSRTRPMPGLEAFKQRFDPHSALVVGETGIPLHEFLSAPAAHWFDSS
ncbi:MAG: ATP-binding protein [Gammaproteobacteria bacterium]|nr:ATP-binding protein [Gammaproteobacteria bacterium]